MCWQRTLIDLGRKQLNDAINSVAHSSLRRYRAIAAANRKYDGAAFGNFPDVFKKKEEPEPEPQTIGEQKAAQFDREQKEDEEREQP